MSETGWRGMHSAPRDGTSIFVMTRASEQGSAEIDLVRWGMPQHSADEGWVSADDDPGAGIFYSDGELGGWAPSDAPPPAEEAGAREPVRRPAAAKKMLEVDGSGI